MSLFETMLDAYFHIVHNSYRLKYSISMLYLGNIIYSYINTHRSPLQIIIYKYICTSNLIILVLIICIKKKYDKPNNLYTVLGIIYLNLINTSIF